jgi:hypothetical protein
MAATYEYTTQDLGDGTVRLTIRWLDGAVEIITGVTHVKGDVTDAEAYARVFADDLRRNFAERFPPELLPAPTGGLMP